MNRPLIFLLPVLALIALAAALPTAAQSDTTPGVQRLAIADARTGDAPCGFPVAREVNGSVSVVPRLDERGNLVLEIERVDLRGTLVNPETGKSIELKWVTTNGSTTVTTTQNRASIAFSLTGHLFRGYSMDPTGLDLSLPLTGGALVDYEPGGPAADPWAHACGMLS